MSDSSDVKQNLAELAEQVIETETRDDIVRAKETAREVLERMKKEDSIKLKDYELETIKAIRARTNLDLSDADWQKMYHMFSEEQASAGWLSHNNTVIEQFLEWLTVPPIDREQIESRPLAKRPIKITHHQENGTICLEFDNPPPEYNDTVWQKYEEGIYAQITTEGKLVRILLEGMEDALQGGVELYEVKKVPNGN